MQTHRPSCLPSVWDPGPGTSLLSDVCPCHVIRRAAGPGHVDDPFHDGVPDPMVLLCREASLGTGPLVVYFCRGSLCHLRAMTYVLFDFQVIKGREAVWPSR